MRVHYPFFWSDLVGFIFPFAAHLLFFANETIPLHFGPQAIIITHTSQERSFMKGIILGGGNGSRL